jgi:hypothetical protein
MAKALRPAAGSKSALIRDDPAIVWKQAWNDKIGDAAELRDGAQCGGYRLPQASSDPVVSAFNVMTSTSPARETTRRRRPSSGWRLPISAICSGRTNIPLIFLVGAAHPTLDAHVAAAARTRAGQYRREVAKREANPGVLQIQRGDDDFADVAIGYRLAGSGFYDFKDQILVHDHAFSRRTLIHDEPEIGGGIGLKRTTG